MGLFGTDGIRGRIYYQESYNPLEDFIENNFFSNELCSEIAYRSSQLSGEGEIIIGWDRRPLNEEKANSIFNRLVADKRDVVILGETTTPALQYEMTSRGSVLGIMITASHNPSTDTGIKIMFQDGRKPTFEEERKIEATLFVDDYSGDENYNFNSSQCNSYFRWISRKISKSMEENIFPEYEIFIDGSGGWIASWLSNLLASNGIKCKEVSDRKIPINSRSGAGSLKEGKLSWEECRDSPHLMLSKIEPAPAGTIYGFSFDGDGDRCFLICSDGKCARVVGGDGFTRLYLAGLGDNCDATVCLTIESSLDLSNMIAKKQGLKFVETGVGDRWLQHALIHSPTEKGLGSEPSGHIVMKHLEGAKGGYWGDGVVTMIEFLDLIRICGDGWIETINPESGFTINRSIFPSMTGLWNPNGETGKRVIDVVSEAIGLHLDDIEIIRIENESSLLFLRFRQKGDWSIAVRNSGTEQKTRLTIRTTTVSDENAELVAEIVNNALQEMLSPKTDSS